MWPTRFHVLQPKIPNQCVNRFIVDHKSAIRIINSGMRRQNRVVRLNNCGTDSRTRVDREFQLALFPEIIAQLLHHQTGEPGTRSSAERVKN